MNKLLIMAAILLSVPHDAHGQELNYAQSFPILSPDKTLEIEKTESPQFFTFKVISTKPGGDRRTPDSLLKSQRLGNYPVLHLGWNASSDGVFAVLQYRHYGDLAILRRIGNQWLEMKIPLPDLQEEIAKKIQRKQHELSFNVDVIDQVEWNQSDLVKVFHNVDFDEDGKDQEIDMTVVYQFQGSQVVPAKVSYR